jgi:diaminopimelate epimerase
VARSTEAGFVADVRIFNPDGSEAELSGNGVRQAILYVVRHGWTASTQFSVRTKAGEIRPTVLDERTCRVDMGRARLQSPGFPSGGRDGTGEVRSGERAFRFQHVDVGNPQCAIRLGSAEEVDTLDLAGHGPAIERSELFPPRTNVSFWTELAPDTIRARIFERGVGETQSSGTGACGAAVAHVLRGGDTPVTVRLDGGELVVDVGEDLHIDLTGWAVPVFRAETL